MKIWSIFLLVFTMYSCGNEFDLIEETKDIPIVYGIIDLMDTAQYIRVERAFVDPNISALDLAMDPNNLYYENLDVTLIRDGQEYNLIKIDGDAEGLPRREGIFAQSPNTLYKIDSNEIPLNSGDQVELRINRMDTFAMVTASTTLVESGKITRPTVTGSMDFDYIQPTNISWIAGDNAGFYDLSVVVNYLERDMTVPGPFEQKSIQWDVINNTEEKDILVDGIKFYDFLAGNMEVNETLVRRFLNLDVVLYSGGEEIRDYIRIGQANLGITSSQDIPTFTNLSEGRGLFSSRTSVAREAVPITGRSLDSLVQGQITKALNFEF